MLHGKLYHIPVAFTIQVVISLVAIKLWDLVLYIVCKMTQMTSSVNLRKELNVSKNRCGWHKYGTQKSDLKVVLNFNELQYFDLYENMCHVRPKVRLTVGCTMKNSAFTADFGSNLPCRTLLIQLRDKSPWYHFCKFNIATTLVVITVYHHALIWMQGI